MKIAEVEQVKVESAQQVRCEYRFSPSVVYFARVYPELDLSPFLSWCSADEVYMPRFSAVAPRVVLLVQSLPGTVADVRAVAMAPSVSPESSSRRPGPTAWYSGRASRGERSGA